METEPSSRPHSAPARPALSLSPPRRRRPLIWVAITAAFTAMVIQYSFQHGKLAMYPFYDDVSYFMDALVRLQELYTGGWRHLARAMVERPPHSVFSCVLALGAYIVLGTQDWVPYAANGVIILGLAGVLNFLAHGLPRWQRLLLFLIVLTVPICQNAVYEFRPDIASALCAAAGGAVLLSRPFTAGAWQHRVGAGAMFGLSMLIKTPTFPLTMAVLFVCVAAAVAADALIDRRMPRLEPLAISVAQTVGAAVLVPLPFYAFQLRQIIAYIWEPIFGSTKDLWATPLTPREHVLYYLTGEGGSLMLSSHLYLLGAILVAGFALAIVFSRRDVVVRLAGFCLAAGAAFAIPTKMRVKQPFFGTTFDWLLIFAGLYVLLWVCQRGHRVIAGGILAVVLLGAVGISHFVPELYKPGGANVVQRRRIISSVYNALRQYNVGDRARIYMTTTGYVNAAVLDYLNLQQGLPAFNIAEQPYSPDLKLHESEMDKSDYVIASEQGNSESFGNFIPSGNMQDATLAHIRANPDFAEIAAIPTQNEKRFFVFKRVPPFYGWDVTTGLGPVEGPYPDWKLREVRWGFGPKTVATLPPALTTGDYLLVVSGKPALANLEMTVRIDGREVGRHVFPSQLRFDAFELPVHLGPGRHEIELDYANWAKVEPRPMAVLFQTMKLLPAADAATTKPATQ